MTAKFAKLGALIGTGSVIALLSGTLFFSASAEDKVTIEAELAKSTDEQLTGPPKTPKTLGAPDVTNENVRAIRAELHDVKANGGHLEIGRRYGQSKNQVKAIRKAMDAELTKRAKAKAEEEAGEVEVIK